MPAPYSSDLRQRVVEKYNQTKTTFKQLSTDFLVSAKTVYRWVKQHKENGRLEAKTGYQKGHSHIVKNPQTLIKLLESNNFSTIEEIKNEIKCGSESSIRRTLKRLGYVKKKEKNYTESKIKKK